MHNKTISFHRQYRAYSGGHQKVHDYLQHTISTQLYAPSIFLEAGSKIQPQLFNDIQGVEYQSVYAPQHADVAFLAGMDWQAYLPFFAEKQIKVNLVQHIRHGEPQHPLHQFLQYKAIRLCVSEAVKKAIEPYANGPCFTIPMGHTIPVINKVKNNDIYILATKQPALGQQLFEWASQAGLKVILDSSPVERERVYQTMAASKVVIPLPNKTEGFFLPGIEAMTLADWAVVPDCIASREYCLPMANVTRCELSLSDCQSALEYALKAVNKWQHGFLKWRGRSICNKYSLINERRAYQAILSRLDSIW